MGSILQFRSVRGVKDRSGMANKVKAFHVLPGYLKRANRIRKDEGVGPLLEAAKITDFYIKTFNLTEAKEPLGKREANRYQSDSMQKSSKIKSI